MFTCLGTVRALSQNPLCRCYSYSRGFKGREVPIKSAEFEALYTLAVRPLSRRDLLLGKFLGLAAMLVTYAALFFLALAGLVY
ncbi:MAG: hypothetical protein AB2448_08340 [Moorella sp. (in: firmicutes)]